MAGAVDANSELSLLDVIDVSEIFESGREFQKNKD